MSADVKAGDMSITRRGLTYQYTGDLKPQKCNNYKIVSRV